MVNYERNKDGFGHSTDGTTLTFTLIEPISPTSLDVKFTAVSISGHTFNPQNVRMVKFDSAIPRGGSCVSPIGNIEFQPTEGRVSIVAIGPVDIYGGTASPQLPSYITIRQDCL